MPSYSASKQLGVHWEVQHRIIHVPHGTYGNNKHQDMATVNRSSSIHKKHTLTLTVSIYTPPENFKSVIYYAWLYGTLAY